MKKNIITFTINWWVNKIPVLVFGFIFLVSCKRDQEFDLAQKSSASGIGVIFTDTITVETSTIFNNDSLVTNRPLRFLFGAFTDIETGTSYAEAYFRLYPKVDNIDYSGATVDSAFFYIDYDYAYGDTLQNQTISAYELTVPLSETVVYKSTDNSITYSSTEAGNTSVSVRPNTKDHLIKIELTNLFATDLLAKADDKNSVDLQTSFYGLVLKASTTNGAIIGGINSKEEAVPATRLVVYYKQNSENKSTIFRTFVGAPSFNKFYADRSGTPLASLINSGDEISNAVTNNNTFVQAGMGLYTKIKFPNLVDFSKYKDSAVIINKASLKIYPKSGSISGYPLVTRCNLIELNSNNTFMIRDGIYAAVQSTGAPQSGTGFAVNSDDSKVANDGYYEIDITSYIQSLIYKKISTNGIALYPSNNSYYINRSVLNSQQSSSGTDKIQLQIYYTLLK